MKFQIVDPITKIRSLAGVAERLGTSQATLKFKSKLHDDYLRMNIEMADHKKAIDMISEMAKTNHDLTAIGHRVVHGGDIFTESVKIDARVKTLIKSLHSLAPLHNPNNLIGIELLESQFSDLPQVAVFDSTFHVKTLPEKAFRYAIPEDWYVDHKVRRYGFHGTSHMYVANEFARMIKKPLNELSLITAHLGNGCSVCAIKNGKSVDTSMGFSPLEGLVMGTRSGDIDPSIVAYMAEKLKCSADEILANLRSKSGLLAIAGVQDSRDIEQLFFEGDKRAELAIQMFCYRIAKYLASYVVPLEKIPDGIIFTGGIGERSPLKRKFIIDLLKPLGFKLDQAKNEKSEATISSYDSRGAISVISTDEELVIAQETLKVATNVDIK